MLHDSGKATIQTLCLSYQTKFKKLIIFTVSMYFGEIAFPQGVRKRIIKRHQ